MGYLEHSSMRELSSYSDNNDGSEDN